MQFCSLHQGPPQPGLQSRIRSKSLNFSLLGNCTELCRIDYEVYISDSQSAHLVPAHVCCQATVTGHQRRYLAWRASPHGCFSELWGRKRFSGKKQYVRAQQQPRDIQMLEQRQREERKQAVPSGPDRGTAQQRNTKAELLCPPTLQRSPGSGSQARLHAAILSLDPKPK